MLLFVVCKCGRSIGQVVLLVLFADALASLSMSEGDGVPQKCDMRWSTGI